jgi:hypothetical protein
LEFKESAVLLIDLNFLDRQPFIPTALLNPGLSGTFRDGWQLCNYGLLKPKLYCMFQGMQFPAKYTRGEESKYTRGDEFIAMLKVSSYLTSYFGGLFHLFQCL